MTAPWSPQQREWLQALGHDVLVLAGAAIAPERSAVAPSSRRGLADPPPVAGPLLRAVLRAAGRREIGELAAWLPDPASLRGDAAAKRALWPRLRALRKPSGP